MSIIELLFMLKVNDFTAPDADELKRVLTSDHYCQESPEENGPTISLKKYLEVKNRMGGMHAYIQ